MKAMSYRLAQDFACGLSTPNNRNCGAHRRPRLHNGGAIREPWCRYRTPDSFTPAKRLKFIGGGRKSRVTTQ